MVPSPPPANDPAVPPFEVEVFFDGDCPLCRREIRLLRALDRAGRIRFTDLADPAFDPAALGVSSERLMARIHARLPDGALVEGVEVFRRLYGAVGFRGAVRVSRWPGVSHALDLAYRIFARNRLRLTGRCPDGRCEVPRAPAAATGAPGSGPAAPGPV